MGTKEMRGDVIEKSIEIEDLISEIVTRHYFGRIYEQARPFIREVLNDTSFSFTLRINVLCTVFDRWERRMVHIKLKLPKTIDLKKLKGKLRGLNDMRNVFAHHGRKEQEKPLDFDKEHASFISLHKEVSTQLRIILKCFAEVYPSNV